MANGIDLLISAVVILVFLYIILSGVAKKRGNKNVVELFDGLFGKKDKGIMRNNRIAEKIQGGLKS